MDRDTFTERFESMGFDVSTDYVPADPDEDPTLVAENQNGDSVHWCVMSTSDHMENPDWGVAVSLQGFTLDTSEFPDRDIPRRLTFEDDALVIEDVTGTRSKEFGFGRAGWKGDLRIDRHGAEVTETYRA